MTDAPDRIWAKIHGASTDVMSGQRGLLGAWHERQREGHVGYVREDLVEAAEAENQRLREALTRVAKYREEAHAHDDDMGHLRRCFDISAVIRMETIARAALRRTEASHDD